MPTKVSVHRTVTVRIRCGDFSFNGEIEFIYTVRKLVHHGEFAITIVLT
jgi:hypothetical protein